MPRAVTTPALIDAMRRISELLQPAVFAARTSSSRRSSRPTRDFVEGLRLLAGTKQALGDPAAAEELLRRALALDPSWTPTLATSGELLLVSGRGSEAESLLQRALAGSPPYPARGACCSRATTTTCGARPRRSRWPHRCAVSGKADADSPAQHIAALAALGRQEEAVAAYRRLVAAAPDNLAAAHALAIALNMRPVSTRKPRASRSRRWRAGTSGGAIQHLCPEPDRTRRARARRGRLARLPARSSRACSTRTSNLAQLIWMRTGDIAQATAALDRALQTFANDEALWAAKAAILQGAGDARAAYACLAPWASRAAGVRPCCWCARVSRRWNSIPRPR